MIWGGGGAPTSKTNRNKMLTFCGCVNKWSLKKDIKVE